MRISFSPQRSDETLDIVKAGDTLKINGRLLNFAVVPEGATLPADAVDSPFIAGDVTRVDGRLHIALRLPHGQTSGRFAPDDIVDPSDGPLTLPQPEEAE